MYYPLTISSEYYKFDESTLLVRENKSKVQELKQMIKCDVTDIFVTELRRLTDSEIHFCNWANSVYVCISYMNCINIDFDQFFEYLDVD